MDKEKIYLFLKHIISFVGTKQGVRLFKTEVCISLQKLLRSYSIKFKSVIMPKFNPLK